MTRQAPESGDAYTDESPSTAWTSAASTGASGRDRLSAGFQDVVRFQETLERSVGIGDLPRVDDRARYDVVLDVPQGATLLAYGILLSGAGDVGVAGLRFDKVDDTVPATERRRLDRPANLDFSDA